MATTTTQQGFPVPEPTDAPNHIAQDITALANAIEKRVMGVYVSITARNAAVTSPQDGQFSYIRDSDIVQVYQNGAWTNFPPTQVSITSGTTVPANSTGNNGDVFFKV